jgi:hypothetical protein
MTSNNIANLINEVSKLKKKRWLSPAELEKEYSLTKSTQAKMRMGGKLPYSKIGALVRYDREEIDKLWEKSKIVSLEHCSGGAA